MQKTINKGKKEISEDIVCKYLKERKYIIIERNFEYKKEKIDLIAFDEKTKELVFINLKLYFTPKEINQKETIKKQDILKSMARYYNYEYGLYDIPVRFDMVKIFLSNSIYKLKHIKKIFS